MYTYATLQNAMEKSGKQYNTDQIEKAYVLAAEAHKHQQRESGEPYIVHPLAVACILVELGMDSESVEAALLHDVVEDTDVTLETLSKQFGSEVAQLVDGVTKIGKIPLITREEQQAENIRKMLLAMSQDVRVIIIKLADRLHNLRTLEYRSEQKRRDVALETMEIYAPIAHRLGIHTVKEEMDDLSLRYLDPVAYNELEQALEIRKDQRVAFLDSIKQKVTERIAKDGFEPYIEGRVKSIYGIYRKVYIQGKAFEEVFDVYAVRIIVNTVEECYNVLGVIHDMFRPLPNRFKDYISTPKPNMYQSLHTTVIGKEAIPFEIQIRTWDMHYTAEYGIAAHWKYKAGVSGTDSLEQRLAWVRQLIEAQQESEDAEDLIRSIKTDLAPDEVFVFTPKGDVINLPAGSTVIDFAYAIHSAVGNRMIGAKVDTRMVPIDYAVKNGQIIEIITTNAQGHGPSRDWLKIVKTSEARNKIRSWFKKEKREENIAEGKAEIEREFRRNNISLPDAKMQEFLLESAKRWHFNNVEEFYAAIGYGGIQLSKIIPKIKEEYGKLTSPTEESVSLESMIQTHKPGKKGSGGVIVEGIDNCLVKFSKCCNPLPGDEIIGFITRGYGVSIHKCDCPNVVNGFKDNTQRERWVRARWDSVQKEVFKSTLSMLSTGRQGVLADLSVALNNMRVPIHALNAREIKNGNLEIVVTIAINDVEQLTNIITKLRKINGIISVERLAQS